MATLDWSQCPAVESIPGKVSGAWVFKDTRMPVATVLENLESGATIDQIMEWFGKGFYERGCQAKTLLLLEEGLVFLGIQPPSMISTILKARVSA